MKNIFNVYYLNHWLLLILILIIYNKELSHSNNVFLFINCEIIKIELTRLYNRSSNNISDVSNYEEIYVPLIFKRDIKPLNKQPANIINISGNNDRNSVISRDIVVGAFWYTDEESLLYDGFVNYCPQLQSLGLLEGDDPAIVCSVLTHNIINFLNVRLKWTDEGYDYVTFVEKVVNSNNITLFNNFKSNEYYQEIVETLGHATAEQYYAMILRDGLHYIIDKKLMWRLAENDNIGNPPRLLGVRPPDITILDSSDNDPGVYPGPDGMILMSVLTYRYLYVLVHIDNVLNFTNIIANNNNTLSIAEIGVGYGGQAQALLAASLSNVLPWSNSNLIISYDFYDLQPVCSLAERYLQEFSFITERLITNNNAIGSNDVQFQLNYCPDNNSNKVIRDICISNYAISELPRSLQDYYLVNVLSNCISGYVIYNSVGYGQSIRNYSYSPGEFAQHISTTINNNRDNSVVRIVTEEPLTHVDNVIIIWGPNISPE